MLKSAWCNYSGEARVRWRVLMSNEANPERKVFAALDRIRGALTRLADSRH